MTPKSVKKLRSKRKLNYQYPVLIVSRSNKNILAQVFESTTNKTLATFTSNKISGKTKTEKSAEVGNEVSKFLKSKKIEKVTFDRNGYIYHGRVKSLVDAVRAGGVEI
jgi:large subunit ribosomal protein L18